VNENIVVDGQTITLATNALGLQAISYNGVEVSRKYFLVGGSHAFTVNEEGSATAYVVRLKAALSRMSFDILIKKNGHEALETIRRISFIEFSTYWLVILALILTPILTTPSKARLIDACNNAYVAKMVRNDPGRWEVVTPMFDYRNFVVLSESGIWGPGYSDTCAVGFLGMVFSTTSAK